MIFGRPGGGKSTFALKLSKLLGIPVHHLDRHFFVENWVKRNYQEFLAIQQSLVAEESWIIDGNSTKSLEMRYQRANLVIYFNYPRWQCYRRVFKRLTSKDPAIKDRAGGCYETLRWSLLKYMWTFEKRIEKQLLSFKEKYPEVQFIEICSDEELRTWEESLTYEA
jgi:adenylate kinase family enzyme